MTDWETDLLALLVADGICNNGGSVAWAGHVGEEPEVRTGVTPEQVITITATQGLPSNPKWAMDEPTAQVRIRGGASDYTGTKAKAFEVADALLGRPAETINSNDYRGFYVDNGPGMIGRDENRRPIFVLNVRALVEPAATGNRLAYA